MYDQIPDELKQLPQWVVVGQDKEPRTVTGAHASVTDRATWTTFEAAVATGRPIGFVFTAEDPYCFIDLDDPWKTTKNWTSEQRTQYASLNSKIYESVLSYSEVSLSGRGIHIIARANLPAGARRDTVEIYTKERYAIFTGNVCRALPITDQQALCEAIYNEAGGASRSVTLEQHDSTLSDEDLLAMGSNAENGAKFDQLWRGDWQNVWPSQSEADFALLSMLAFYSVDNEQVRRCFRMSELGRRSKATKNDKYLDRCLAKIRAKEPPPVNLENLRLQAVRDDEGATQGATYNPPVTAARTPLPPGLIGELALYIESQALRPVPEIALAAAIALVAGIAGRSYNVKGTGLNQYLVLLAETGSGKEAAASGIDRLIAAVRTQVPMASQFIGPGVFSSGQALARLLDERPCFVSVMGEFGLRMQQLNDPRAPSHILSLKQMLLDIYNKSGFDRVVQPSVYSDKEKNTNPVQAPNVTILGEATPSSFYEAISSKDVEHGLLSRFSIIEYRGKRVARNGHIQGPPDDGLTTRLANLCGVALYTMNNHTVCNVPINDEAAVLLDAFDVYADGQINNGNTEFSRQLWNRVYQKAIKLAALVAVGVNTHAPVIDIECAKWAVDFVYAETLNMLAKFEKNEIGSGEAQGESQVRKIVADYRAMKPKQRVSYGAPENIAHLDIIPYCYLRRRMRQLSIFYSGRNDARDAISKCLLDMCEGGVLKKMSVGQVSQQFSTTMALYVVGPQF